MNTHRLRAQWVVVGENRGVLVALIMLALAGAGCTSTMSLGAAGMPDGGDTIVITSNDAGDAPADLPADSSPDVPTDAPADQNADGTAVTCVDHGVTYHVGDVIPRGTAACTMSCLCLGNGTVGACTGVACPADGSPPDELGLEVLAQITLTRSTNSPEFRVTVYDNGSADRVVIAPTGSPSYLRAFPHGSPEVAQFLSDLNAVGSLSAVGDPGPIFGESCAKSGSLGTQTYIVANGVTSGDIQCLVNPTSVQTALAHDTDVLLGVNQGTYLIDSHTCLQTGGLPTGVNCCAGSGDFPDTCAVGACTCAPASSESVDICVCPNGCFMKSGGCVGPANICTVGQDQTCNDNIALNSFHGHCLDGGRCSCITGSTVLASGKCS